MFAGCLAHELSDFCFNSSDQLADFEVTLDAKEAPTSCALDCGAHLFFFSEECVDLLHRRHLCLVSFSELCFTTHRDMQVISADGYFDAGGHTDYTFQAQRGLVYSIEVPGDGLHRTDHASETPHSHHVTADRIDVLKHGAGVHTIVRSLLI